MYNYVKRELELLEQNCEDESELEMQKMISNNILKIVKVFQEGGHSGFSASYTVSLLERLLRFKPLTPLTGEDDEWVEVSDCQEQNKRCSEVFRDIKDNSTAYTIGGKVFSDDNGETYYSNSDSIVKITFPYNVTQPERVKL